jgi:hypothetical protein
MRELLGPILEIEDVQGVSLISFEGDVIFQEPLSLFGTESEKSQVWQKVMDTMQGIREADLFFEKMRLYMRRTDPGYIVIVMGLLAPAAMVRMHCDMLLSSLKQSGKPKGLRSFFTKKTL